MSRQPYIVHPTDLQYAPTIMRAPSPSSTIGTDYAPDQTTMVDSELSDSDFARKCEETIGLNNPRADEEEANRDPLILSRPLSRHKFTQAEERQMVEHVMNNLRAAVKKLEEDELFEQTAVRGAELAMEDPPPSSSDVDAIMQSLMGLATPSSADEDTAPSTAQASARFSSRSETVTPQWGAPPPAPSHGWYSGV